MNGRYPRLEINLAHLKENVETIVGKCGECGIQVAGVIKGATGLPEVAKAFDQGGVEFIASSRLEQLEDAKNAGVKKPLMLIRIPMLSEVSEAVRISDICLASEVEVIEALSNEALRQGKEYKVILMVDLGDLREGFWEKQEMIDAALYIETKLKGVKLVGLGTNLGCYGSIVPTVDKLEQLVADAEAVEAKLGRKLEYISGGATTSLIRVWNKDMPKRINLLRVGEAILLARDLDVFYGLDMSKLHRDVFRLKAEIIELKTKPSHPVGTIAIDAFGHTPTYVDRGMRKRALLGVGKVDYGDPGELISLEKGIEILGASSDHTIIDIENAEKDYKIGDIMTFDICYATLVYVTNCRNINIVYV